ncbi:MAG: LPXTG cell wall anchor domain-containing protein, partial [Clostridiales bacterium]|nr:LPXTG cell wall anchor domain-containing protein [Clostridiales bacterium]
AFAGEPVREGYKFIGWSPVVAETVTGDAVYYAQWEKLPEEPSVVDPSGDNNPIDDGKDIDAQPNGDADTEAKGVKTGDETMLAMWGALGLIAALGLGGTLVIGRRREE